MAVEIWSRNMLNPVTVEGDLEEVANSMNYGNQQGSQFVMLDEAGAGRVAIDRTNITVMRESVDAFAN